jgi:hypothetical protein
VTTPKPGGTKFGLDALVNERIRAIAPTISTQPLGLVHHRPEDWAQPARCFENAARKVRQNGGRTMFGWTFHHRFALDIPGPGYLFLTHHAVWHEPDGKLIDVTPYLKAKHRPLPPGDSILFLVDARALPVTRKNLVAPLPLRFFALDDDEPLAAYIEQLNGDEQRKCEEIYAGRLPLEEG